MSERAGADPGSGAFSKEEVDERGALRRLRALWQFTRPHTILGSTLSLCGIYTITAARTGQLGAPRGLWALVLALAVVLAGNVYIVGINQIRDVEIDRINKPYLPLAAGDLTTRVAMVLVCVTGVAALIAALVIAPLSCFLLLALALLIGSAYSLPPLHLKRFPVWAALCIVVVRGPIVNVGATWYFNAALGAPREIPPSVWVLTAFVTGFAFAIAWLKDIPDIDGDRRFNILTLSARLGARSVFRLGRAWLSACYLGVVGAVILGVPGLNRPFLIVSHLAVVAWVWIASRRVQPGEKASITRFYMFVWRLFALEYVLFPIACVIA